MSLLPAAGVRGRQISVSSKLAGFIERVPGQPELHCHRTDINVEEDSELPGSSTFIQ